MKVSDIVLSEIKRRGITKIFGVPGRETSSIRFNEVDGIDYFATRNEFCAGIMAEFTGRVLKTPQVCFATMGPGATNLTTAIASAMLNLSPTVFITAQIESDDLFYNSAHQCINQAELFKPITKWSYQIAHPDEVYDALQRAFYLALEDPIGPVHLAIPTNFFDADVHYFPEPIRTPPEEHSTSLPPSLRRAEEVLTHSRYPIAIIGGQVIRRDATKQLVEFLDDWSIPFFTTANAKGIKTRKPELNLGAASCYMEGIYGIPALRQVFEEADLILTIGYQYVDDVLPKMWQYGQPKTIVNLTAESSSKVRARFTANVECVGNLSKILPALRPRSKDVRAIRDFTNIQNAPFDCLERQPQLNGRLTPLQVIHELNKVSDGGIIVTDIGYYRHHAVLFADVEKPSHFFSDTGLSSFGSGLPMAAAAKLAFPEKQVYLLCGDGGFHSGSGDLETLRRYKLGVTILLLDSCGFKLIENYQRRKSNSPNLSSVDLGSVDFSMIAEANRCIGVQIADIDQLRTELKRKSENSPRLLHIKVGYPDDEEFRESF